MDDDAGGLVEYRLVGWKGPDRIVAPQALLFQQALVAVRLVQRLEKGAVLIAAALHLVDHARQIKVMQDHHARMPLQHVEHVAMHVIVAEVVDDTVEFVGVLVEPGGGAQREVGTQGYVTDTVLFRNQFDVIVLRQRRNDVGAVVGDAGAFRRQWR